MHLLWPNLWLAVCSVAPLVHLHREEEGGVGQTRSGGGLWFPGLARGLIQTWGTRSSQVNRNQPRKAAAALLPWVLFNLEELRRAASLWIIAFPGLWISEPLVLSIAFQTRTCFRLPCTQIAVMWANNFDKICSFEKKHFRLTRTCTAVDFFEGAVQVLLS